MTTLLIMTTGQTDVQLVEDGKRFEFAKESCAPLHDELERRREEWALVDTPVKKADDKKSKLPTSKFELCTPKLDAILEYVVGKGFNVTHALILDTRRDSNAATSDPRFAGEIVKRRLCGKVKNIEAECRSYLTDNERIEDRNEPRDAVIRREVVKRIHSALQKSIEKSKPDRIVVAATGGFPTVNALVEEMVRCFADPQTQVEYLEIADGSTANPPTHDQAVPRKEIPEPIESYRARHHALALIERGDFLGAWGAVRHLHDDKIEQKWTRVVYWLAQFAASLPLPDKCDIDLLKHPRMAVRSALRTELALRAGDIPRAVHGTVAFFEAALWDHLLGRAEPHHEKKRLYKLDSELQEEKLIRSDGVDERENRKRPFELAETKNGVKWYRINDGKTCGVRIAKHYLEQKHLTELGKAVDRVRDFRNDVAHTIPTPELMEEARNKMKDAGLWSEDNRFLKQELVRNVLEELGETDTDEICCRLINSVRKCLSVCY